MASPETVKWYSTPDMYVSTREGCIRRHSRSRFPSTISAASTELTCLFFEDLVQTETGVNLSQCRPPPNTATMKKETKKRNQPLLSLVSPLNFILSFPPISAVARDVDAPSSLSSPGCALYSDIIQICPFAHSTHRVLELFGK